MKTLNIALLTLALTAGAGSAALALDGPHGASAGSVAYNDSYQTNTAVTGSNQIDQQSDATLQLNIRGEAASQHH